MKGQVYLAALLWIAFGLLPGAGTGETLGMDGKIHGPIPAPMISLNTQNQGEEWVRMAVIAASQQGLPGDRPLHYAYQDGERLGKMISTVGQVEASNLFYLKVESRAVFLDGLQKVGKRIEELKNQNKKVLLQFYFSGHGGAHNFHFQDGKLSFAEVKEALGGNRADARVYVLDVCFGASFFTAKGFRTTTPLQLQMEMDQGAKGEVTISSSSVNEQAYEVRTLGGSIFTSQWIMALRGAGDGNRDGQVTLFEAYNYAYDRTTGYSSETLDRPQHPAYQIDLTGARDVLLARLLPTSSGILFQHCPQGLYTLIDLQRGSQIGELRIPAGDDFTLALEPGQYRVLYRRPQGASLAANVVLPATGMTNLPFTTFKTYVPTAAGLDVPKGGLEEIASPVQPSLLAQIGYAAWMGMGVFNDSKLTEDLNQPLEVNRYFGFDGGFRLPSFRGFWGLELEFPLVENWTSGFRIGFKRMQTNWSSTGTEPLHSASDSVLLLNPVHINWNYTLSDQQFGGYLSRNFNLTRRQSFRFDGCALFQIRQMTSSSTIGRSLFGLNTTNHEKSTGSGFQLEAGATWFLSLSSGGLSSDRRAWLMGLRIAPYFSKIDDDSRRDKPLTLDSRELGISTSLTLSLQGRGATVWR